ncbi:MAG: hypothetical protein KIT14_23285 [bacterium]|nr:hypothetical protein [bacterium]
MSKPSVSLAGALALAAVLAAPAGAQITTAPGWHYYAIPTPGAVQGGVVRAGDAVLVGQGAFGAGLQQIIRLENGVATTIATGFNSLGGFALAPNGTLFVVDNGGNVPGALTGDTAFAIPDALTRATAVAALGAEVAPAGSIPFAQDVVVDGADLLVSDAAGPGAGRVVRVSGGVVTPIITGLGYAAGLTVDGTRLLVGDVDGFFVGSLAEYTLGGTFVTAIASGLSGEYAQELDNDGNVLVTGGFLPDFSSSNVLAIAPGGAQSQRAWGFVFTTELFHDAARDETLVLDYAATSVAAICRDVDGDDVCDADALCNGGAIITKAKATITKLATPPGDDGLKFGGEMVIPTIPAIDPVANGVHIVLGDALGTVADVAIPGGAFDPAAKAGWKANGTGTSFTFTSKTGVAGVTKVSVKAVPKTPGLLKLKVTGKKGSFPVTPAGLPLVVTFVLAPDGQCGTADFSGPAPICAFNGSGTTLKCK